MANMSYCRFENTLRDLLDCQRVMEESSPEELLEGKSDIEVRSYKQLLEVCREISEEFDEE